MCAARACQCVSFFAQRATGWLVGRSIGSRPVSLRDRDNPFLVTFLGKQKSDKLLGREMVVFTNSLVHVILKKCQTPVCWHRLFYLPKLPVVYQSLLYLGHLCLPTT